MPRNVRFGGLLILASILPAGGCDSVDRALFSFGDWAGERVDSFAARKANDDPMIVEVAGPIGIDVDSFNGSVAVEVNRELEDATVTVTRRAVHGYGRSEEADLSLDSISCSVEVVPGELGQVLHIRTATTHPEPHYQRVDIEIEAPDVDGLRVRTSNGDVIAINIQGNVDVVTDYGDVRIMTVQAMLRPIMVVNNSGDIDLRVRGESRGDLNFETVRGRVLHHVEHGRVIVHTGTDNDTLLASFNQGGNPYTLRAVDGDIRFASVPEPTLVGTLIGF